VLFSSGRNRFDPTRDTVRRQKAKSSEVKTETDSASIDICTLVLLSVIFFSKQIVDEVKEPAI
jgi:hypothetical protein